MEIDELVKRRKSVRSFKKKKASWKDVLEAIDVAIQGPFAGNYNNLRFMIVEDKKTIMDIADLCEQDWISEVGILVLVCSDDSHLENTYGDRGRVYSRQQAGAAIYSFMLKLSDLGLGSCWVGSYNDGAIRDKLRIPTYIQIEAIVPVGFESGSKKKEQKKDLENVLYWEEWGKGKRPTPFDEGLEDYAPDKWKKE
jgi:nitroreductase